MRVNGWANLACELQQGVQDQTPIPETCYTVPHRQMPHRNILISPAAGRAWSNEVHLGLCLLAAGLVCLHPCGNSQVPSNGHLLQLSPAQLQLHAEAAQPDPGQHAALLHMSDDDVLGGDHGQVLAAGTPICQGLQLAHVRHDPRAHHPWLEVCRRQQAMWTAAIPRHDHIAAAWTIGCIHHHRAGVWRPCNRLGVTQQGHMAVSAHMAIWRPIRCELVQAERRGLVRRLEGNACAAPAAVLPVYHQVAAIWAGTVLSPQASPQGLVAADRHVHSSLIGVQPMRQRPGLCTGGVGVHGEPEVGLQRKALRGLAAAAVLQQAVHQPRLVGCRHAG